MTSCVRNVNTKLDNPSSIYNRWRRDVFETQCSNVGLSSKVSKTRRPKLLDIALLNTPLSFEAPRHGTPRISAWTLYHLDVDPWATFLPVTVWANIVDKTSILGMDPSFGFPWWAPKDAWFVQQSAQWPLKVIWGGWYSYQLNGFMRLPNLLDQ